eukprot:1852159-Pleurochrysis_carterae.AAC.1
MLALPRPQDASERNEVDGYICCIHQIVGREEGETAVPIKEAEIACLFSRAAMEIDRGSLQHCEGRPFFCQTTGPWNIYIPYDEVSCL